MLNVEEEAAADGIVKKASDGCFTLCEMEGCLMSCKMEEGMSISIARVWGLL